MRPSNEREQVLLREALRRTSGPERKAFLDELCRGDETLRARLEELLRTHEAARTVQEDKPAPQDEPTVPATVEESLGTSIGRYKLLEKIGEGGFGAVYVAEQREPVKRRVALKIIKLGMDTRQVVARFEAERQALAMMDHPNIAKVLDAGATETGRPYFVMELVKGIPITQYCDREKLGTRERLELFINVCHAIQHAHQKGIIHRDIKPSNILVTLHDGVPVPKVIDFGIAKATQQELTEKTVYTQFQQFIGTPAYMSPEQAEMSGLDIDTRSDIYSLGVLLYELLTGTTPFDTKELLASGVDEMRRIIREREPIQPSTRARQTVSRSATSTPRSSVPSGLSSDLDWIVMKCLEKDRSRRYETANGLAHDVLRHLHDEPVLARPPGRIYRLQKLVRRNKLVFAAAAAFTGALIIGLAVSTWLFFRERESRRLALAAEKAQSELRQQAQEEARKSDQVAQLLKAMLQGVGPSVARGRDTTMLREILDQTSARLGKGLKDQPEVEAELRSTVGDVYCALGQYDEALEMHREALALRRQLWGNTNALVADSLDKVGRMLALGSRIVDAEPFIVEGLTIRTNLLGQEHVKVAASLYHLAQVRFWQLQGPEVENLVRRSLAIRRKLLGDESPEVAESLGGLSNTLLLLGRAPEGETVAREAVALQARLLPDEDRATIDAGLSHISIGWLLQNQGKSEAAEAVLRQELARDKNRLGPEHPEVARDLYRLADVLAALDRLEEAEATARQGLALSRKTLGDQHFYTSFCLQELRHVFVKAGRFAEAETVCREEILSRQKQKLPIAVVGLTIELGDILSREGKQGEAENAYREAVELARQIAAPDSLAIALNSVAESLRQRGDLAQAEPLYREALEICRAKLPDSYQRRWGAVSALTQVLVQQGKTEDAETLCREVMEVTRKAGALQYLAREQSWLADRLRGAGLAAKAEPLYREGLDICRAEAPTDIDTRQWLASGLGVVLKSQGRFPEAEAAMREAVTNLLRGSTEYPAGKRWQLNDLADLVTRNGKDPADDPVLSAVLNPATLAKTSETDKLQVAKDLAVWGAKWKEAAAALKKLIEKVPEESILHLELASTFLADGNMEEYQIACQNMLSRFGKTTVSGSAEQTAKAFLLIPRGGSELQAASRLAATAVTLGKTNAWYSYLLFTDGLAAYRRGEFADAVARMRKVVGQPILVGNPLVGLQRDVAAYSVIGMAENQLKRAEAARAALASADDLAARLPQGNGGGLGRDWVNWVIADILFREAKGLVEGPSPAGPSGIGPRS